MSATSFDEKCKTLNIKPGWIFIYVRSVRVHVIIHGIEYSGDEFLNEPHIFISLPPFCHSFIHSASRYSVYSLFYYPSAGFDPAPLPPLKNEQTAVVK